MFLDRLTATLGLDQVTPDGLSMGGMAGLLFAAEHGRVERLVLVNSLLPSAPAGPAGRHRRLRPGPACTPPRSPLPGTHRGRRPAVPDPGIRRQRRRRPSRCQVAGHQGAQHGLVVGVAGQRLLRQAGGGL